MPELNRVFGEVLAKHRRAAKYSQERLALECDLHPTYISQLERGLKSPTLRILFLISETLHVKPSVLIRDVERKIGPSDQVGK